MILITALQDKLVNSVSSVLMPESYDDQTMGLMARHLPLCSPSHWFLQEGQNVSRILCDGDIPCVRKRLALSHDHNEEREDEHQIQHDNDVCDLAESVRREESQVREQKRYLDKSEAIDVKDLVGPHQLRDDQMCCMLMDHQAVLP